AHWIAPWSTANCITPWSIARSTLHRIANTRLTPYPPNAPNEPNAPNHIHHHGLAIAHSVAAARHRQVATWPPVCLCFAASLHTPDATGLGLGYKTPPVFASIFASISTFIPPTPLSSSVAFVMVAPTLAVHLDHSALELVTNLDGTPSQSFFAGTPTITGKVVVTVPASLDHIIVKTLAVDLKAFYSFKKPASGLNITSLLGARDIVPIPEQSSQVVIFSEDVHKIVPAGSHEFPFKLVFSSYKTATPSFESPLGDLVHAVAAHLVSGISADKIVSPDVPLAVTRVYKSPSVVVEKFQGGVSHGEKFKYTIGLPEAIFSDEGLIKFSLDLQPIKPEDGQAREIKVELLEIATAFTEPKPDDFDYHFQKTAAPETLAKSIKGLTVDSHVISTVKVPAPAAPAAGAVAVAVAPVPILIQLPFPVVGPPVPEKPAAETTASSLPLHVPSLNSITAALPKVPSLKAGSSIHPDVRSDRLDVRHLLKVSFVHYPSKNPSSTTTTSSSSATIFSTTSTTTTTTTTSAPGTVQSNIAESIQSGLSALGLSGVSESFAVGVKVLVRHFPREQ
ncbi:uncharacterized protein BJ171DRAFT_18458, partial [Polychytrium aggregatum]|uniref:uncharacterized protein n=1 Tax=Polychytrium aggregatum TaxID=110093 RepID=UPI0022FF0290